MEGLSRGKPCHFFPASLSMNSLGIDFLAGAPPTRMLVSESVSLDSLSSTSSCSLPEFPDCKPQIFSMVGLGDCLNMFSGGQMTTNRETGNPGTKGVVIATPTSPRLKFLLKECLSISKWAEASAGWQAPGHIPWESVEETNPIEWVPEGSMFSPENFSLALWRSRGGDGEPHPCPMLLPGTNSIPSPNVKPGLYSRRDSIDVELDGLMSELKSLRSFFQTPLEGDDDSSEPYMTSHPDNLMLPSLVVSNSQCTFPIALESSCSISRFNAVPLAHRRGKKVPSPLVLARREKLLELPYPGIPTAFLGSPSSRSPTTNQGDFDDRPILGFDDMISNLRLQCLTMNLQTPPSDESWNSRSATAAPVTLGKVEKNPAETSNSSTESADCNIPRPPLQPLLQPRSGHTSRPKKLCQRVIPKSSDLRSRSPSTPCKVVSPKTRITDQRSVAPKVLRSAMIKVEASGSRTTVKNVRFVLTYRDLDKESLSAEFSNGMIPTAPPPEPSEHQNVPPAPAAAPHSDFTKSVQRSVSLAHRDRLKHSIEYKETHSRHSLPTRLKERPNLVTVNPPNPKIHHGSNDKEESGFVKHVSSRMSTHALGRSSLSRILRGPMFSSKDATISLDAQPRLNENILRRESRIPSSVEKKSRMPVPLRNIFTRFK